MLRAVLNSVFVLLLLPACFSHLPSPLAASTFSLPWVGTPLGEGHPRTEKPISVTSAKRGSFSSPSSMFFDSSFSLISFKRGGGDTQKWGRYRKLRIWISMCLLFTNYIVHKKEHRKKKKQGFTFKVDNQQGPTVGHRELCSLSCGGRGGRGVWGRMDTCVCVAESLCCEPETITTLSISYAPIQHKKQ